MNDSENLDKLVSVICYVEEKSLNLDDFQSNMEILADWESLSYSDLWEIMYKIILRKSVEG